MHACSYCSSPRVSTHAWASGPGPAIHHNIFGAKSRQAQSVVSLGNTNLSAHWPISQPTSHSSQPDIWQDCQRASQPLIKPTSYATGLARVPFAHSPAPPSRMANDPLKYDAGKLGCTRTSGWNRPRQRLQPLSMLQTQYVGPNVAQN